MIKKILFLIILLVAAPAWGATDSVTKSATAENQFTEGIEPYPNTHASGLINISISGTWVATVTLQRSYDGSTWHDVQTWTANAQEQLWDYEAGLQYRIGVKTGGYDSGTVVLRLSR